MKVGVPRFLKRILLVLSCCVGRPPQRTNQEDPAAPRAPDCSEGAEFQLQQQQLSTSPSQELAETALPPSDGQASTIQEAAATADNEQSVTESDSVVDDIVPGPQPGPSQAARGVSQCIYKFKHPLFEEDDFELKVQRSKVCLEYCVHGHNFDEVTTYIRVMNNSYYKNIFIRYTSNQWKTFEDMQASYVRSCGDGESDKFQCDLPFKRGGEIEFAICYRSNGEEHWDNNQGANYSVSHTQ